MKNVLADLAVESEASTALAFRLAASFDAAKDDPAEAAFGRIATAIGMCHAITAWGRASLQCMLL